MKYSLYQVLMERDGLDKAEAFELISDARVRVLRGEDPEEILFNEFGLEPDYVWELI